jgi:thymidylate synthase
MDTYELLHQVIEVPDPSKRVLTLYNRAANPIFQMAETVWILSGRGDAEWICHFNSKLRDFLDKDSSNPNYFHAAYGERILNFGMYKGELISNKVINQIQVVVDELRKDPDSRRAIIILGNPIFDNIQTNDRPCNIVASFKLRKNHLYMSVFNRSNDMLLGLTFTNIVQFTTIQEVVASMLGVELGHYIHYSDSLHIYHSNPLVEKFNKSIKVLDLYDEVYPTSMNKDQNILSVIEKLSLSFEERINDYSNNKFYANITCPYWKSIAHMIICWDGLKMFDNGKTGEVVNAVREIEQIHSEDWKVACFEYLVRWCSKRNLSNVIDYIRDCKTIQSYNLNIRDFIFHGKY